MIKEENQNLKSEKYEPKKNIFRRGFVWRPVPNIRTTVLFFILVGIFFITMGIVLLVYTNKIYEVEVRYDDLPDCKNALKANLKTSSELERETESCNVNMEIKKLMKKPVMFYIQLNNFYQNHRRYIQSYSPKQLKGNVLSVGDIKDNCDPVVTMKDLGKKYSLSKVELPGDAPANPCGLIARSFFNDTIRLYRDEECKDEVDISQDGIAWSSDKKGRYKNADNFMEIQWMDVQQERFMVWMRPAGIPDFRKLWGKINEDLEPGNYTVKIINEYPVSSFKGKKSFVFSTVNKFGGNNKFLGVAYLVVGGVSIVFGITFIVAHFVFHYKDNYKNHPLETKKNE